ncbi:NAD-binding protein, partial [Arthrospira platensis SPKY1]|nr:NAD-binding protein [Arthrospira platensis SPKY1]
LGLTTLVGLVTIALSTYMILYSHPLYERLAPWLGVFERRRPHRELAMEMERRAPDQPDVIVFGLGRYGERLAFGLQEAELQVLGVDFDPEVARGTRRKGLAVRYGDGTDTDFLESLPITGAAWIVSTL